MLCTRPRHGAGRRRARKPGVLCGRPCARVHVVRLTTDHGSHRRPTNVPSTRPHWEGSARARAHTHTHTHTHSHTYAHSTHTLPHTHTHGRTRTYAQAPGGSVKARRCASHVCIVQILLCPNKAVIYWAGTRDPPGAPTRLTLITRIALTLITRDCHVNYPNNPDNLPSRRNTP